MNASKIGMGAAYGTAKSSVGVASIGVMRPKLVMESIVPVVMACSLAGLTAGTAIGIVGDAGLRNLPDKTQRLCNK